MRRGYSTSRANYSGHEALVFSSRSCFSAVSRSLFLVLPSVAGSSWACLDAMLRRAGLRRCRCRCRCGRRWGACGLRCWRDLAVFQTRPSFYSGCEPCSRFLQSPLAVLLRQQAVCRYMQKMQVAGTQNLLVKSERKIHSLDLPAALLLPPRLTRAGQKTRQFHYPFMLLTRRQGRSTHSQDSLCPARKSAAAPKISNYPIKKEN